jgi:hypothetical protein
MSLSAELVGRIAGPLRPAIAGQPVAGAVRSLVRLG